MLPVTWRGKKNQNSIYHSEHRPMFLPCPTGTPPSWGLLRANHHHDHDHRARRQPSLWTFHYPNLPWQMARLWRFNLAVPSSEKPSLTFPKWTDWLPLLWAIRLLGRAVRSGALLLGVVYGPTAQPPPGCSGEMQTLTSPQIYRIGICILTSSPDDQ